MTDSNDYTVMAVGVGAFTQSVLRILKEAGAQVCTYLNRDYAHYGPMSEGETFHKEYYPNPCKILRDKHVDFVVPMAIDWALADWTDEFLGLNIPILSPVGEAYHIERERNFSQQLCRQYGVPFARSFVAQNKFDAVQILRDHPAPYVIKNTFCSPTSPVHTIVCETPEQTRYWIEHVDYKEGVFLQEYLGRCEAGHIAFISNGQIYSLVTNQEYKRAFNGDLGIVAGAPLGGIVEWDPQDKYHLARDLIHPLLPWFQAVNYHGPLQVTAIRHNRQWHVIEFNIRLGVTSGPIILRMIKHPLQVLTQIVNNRDATIELCGDRPFGCSLTLAGYGYPYVQIVPPRLSVQVTDEFDCDVWWNEVDADTQGQMFTSGHRIADIAATGPTVDAALERAYRNIRKIVCPGSYYRTDIGQSLWPPVYD